MYKELGETKSMPLSKYQNNQRTYDMSNKNDVFKLMNAITVGQNAVSEIANVQMVYGIIQETLDNIDVSSVETGDYTLSVRDGSQVITDPNSGITDTVDNILRVYLQASVDNVEYLLLKDWNYSKENLLSLLIEKSNGEKITNVDTAIMKSLYNKLKTTSKVRDGRDFKKGAYSFRDTISKSSEYNNFVKNKNTKMHETFTNNLKQEFDGLTVFPNFKRLNANEFILHPHEEVAVSIAKMYDKYIKPYHDGSPFIFNKNIYYNAHLISVNSMSENKRILKNSNEDISRGIKYGKDLSLQLNEAFKRESRGIESFNTDTDLVNLSNDFQQRFRSLDDINKKVATYVYLTEGVRINSLGKIAKVAEQRVLPPVNENSEALSLLDVGVLKEYLGHYNDSIKQMVKSEIDYTNKENRLKNVDRVVMMQNQVLGNDSIKKDIEENC